MSAKMNGKHSPSVDEYATGFSDKTMRSLGRSIDKGYQRFCEKRGIDPGYAAFPRTRPIQTEEAGNNLILTPEEKQ